MVSLYSKPLREKKKQITTSRTLRMCVVDTKTSYKSVSKSASFQLPPKVVTLMKKKNMELGDADDVVFGRSGSKRRDGTVGILTKGDIDRSSYYQHALHMALIPWRNPDLYFS